MPRDKTVFTVAVIQAHLDCEVGEEPILESPLNAKMSCVGTLCGRGASCGHAEYGAQFNPC